MNTYITERALMQRINRFLAKKKQTLKKQRKNSKHLDETGEYYIIDFKNNKIVSTGINLEALGRNLGILKNNEHKEKEMTSKRTSRQIETQKKLLKKYYTLIKEMKKRNMQIPPESDDIL